MLEFINLTEITLKIIIPNRLVLNPNSNIGNSNYDLIIESNDVSIQGL